MTFSRKVLVGLVSGLVLGVFLGEYAAPLKIAADGFVKLLQMTVLPYVTISIISSLGALNADEAKRLGLKAGAVLLVLWLIAIGFACLFPLAFPDIESARFFSTTSLEVRPPFNFVDLYIPSNPFHSLANNVVPAVVLFSIVVGVALIGIERKQVLLDVLAVASQAVSRATRFVVQLTPYGIFAIAASTAGTLDLQQLGRIQVFLLTYVVLALVIALWVLPGLVSALTPIRFGDILSSNRTAPTRAALPSRPTATVCNAAISDPNLELTTLVARNSWNVSAGILKRSSRNGTAALRLPKNVRNPVSASFG
jgi:Na+/H+-dicarboxylate symporter